MAINTYSKIGAKAATNAKLDKSVFGLSVDNHELLKQAYVTYLSNGRNANANVKTRGLVRGGGKKPWKQKGTGRARFGSSRNPIWRGGGIVFGPTGGENYIKKLPVSTKQLALRQALSHAASENRLNVIDSFECSDGKVASVTELFNKMNLNGNILIVVNDKNDSCVRATNNLQNVVLAQTKYLNVYNIMNADSILVDSKSLVTITEWLGTKQQVKKAEKVEP